MPSLAEANQVPEGRESWVIQCSTRPPRAPSNREKGGAKGLRGQKRVASTGYYLVNADKVLSNIAIQSKFLKLEPKNLHIQTTPR